MLACDLSRPTTHSAQTDSPCSGPWQCPRMGGMPSGLPVCRERANALNTRTPDAGGKRPRWSHDGRRTTGAAAGMLCGAVTLATHLPTGGHAWPHRAPDRHPGYFSHAPRRGSWPLVHSVREGYVRGWVLRYASSAPRHAQAGTKYRGGSRMIRSPHPPGRPPTAGDTHVAPRHTAAGGEAAWGHGTDTDDGSLHGKPRGRPAR